MKYGREDLNYLKINLIRNIIAFIGMIVLFIIGLAKNATEPVGISIILGIFFIFQIIKTKHEIDKIQKG